MLHPVGDPEVAQSSAQLEKIFTQANWEIESNKIDLSGAPRVGLILYASENPPNQIIQVLYNISTWGII